ncbi:MAG: leucine-rich repeat protein [Bacteroides sp.]|nr:leucine-rich repeat protein [Bacteroides sp.]
MNHFTKSLITLILAFFSINSATAYDFEVDGIYYNIISLSDLTCEVTYPSNNTYSREITIPDKVIYNNRSISVSAIGIRAFDSSNLLTSINIPNSVLTIGSYAFNNCRYLTSILIPNSVTSIGQSAFENCSSLTSIVIPNSITYISNGTFKYCKTLKSIEIPNSVTRISSDAFYNCSSLESIEIPNSVTVIESGAFQNCKSLKSIKIPNSVTEISSWIFDDCSSLVSIEIPNSVRIIADYSFKGCPIQSLTIDCDLLLSHNPYLYNVKDLTIGKHTKEVQLKVYECEDLTKLVCHAITPPTGLEATNKQYMDVEVKVPKGCLEAYQNAEGWKNFWNMSEMEDDESGVETVIAETPKAEIARYNLQGQMVGDDYRGIIIVKYSDGSTAKMINQ